MDLPDMGPLPGRPTPGALAEERMLERQERIKAQQLAKAKAYAEQYKASFIRKVEELSARNPDIKPEVFQSIVDEYQKQFPEKEKEMQRIYKEAKSPGELNAAVTTMQAKYGERLRDKIYKDYGDEGVKALQAVDREMKPKNFFEKIISYFYNSDKGGMQWGALGGLLGGGLIGAFFGGKMGGAASFIMPIVSAVIMAVIGSRVIDKEAPLPTPDFHSKHKGKDKVVAKEREKEYADKTLGKQAEDPAVAVVADPDPARNTPDFKGVIITVTDKKNPAYIRTYAGAYDPATKDLRIDTTRLNSADNWVAMSAPVTINNVEMEMEGGAVKSFKLTQDQLEPARKQAEARVGNKDVLADMTPAPGSQVDFAELLRQQPVASIPGDADARSMGIRSTTKPAGPSLV